jgi:beta-lactamase class A
MLIARSLIRTFTGFAALALTAVAPLHTASAGELEQAFDRTLGTEVRAAQTTLIAPVSPAAPRSYGSAFEAQLAALANSSGGRIGVAAMDLTSGRSFDVLGDQPFPLASTSKIAIAATFLDGVDRGRFRMDQMFPLMVPLPSKKFDGPVAPVRAGTMLSAQSLIELSLTRSDNQATDALLAAVGGPQAVTAWARRAGINNFRIDRDIATLVRDDGAVDPATTIDQRDSVTPQAMVRLLTGIYRGQWLSPTSRNYLIATMERCVTGKHRIPALLPEGTKVAHKTGTLANVASDVGLIQLPDGRAMAVAIYVTGQGGKPNRDARIAAIARAIYDGYQTPDVSGYRTVASR